MKVPTITKGEEDHRGTFPIQVLPERIQAICREYETSLQFHLDYVGLATLTALSAAIGTGYKIKVRNLHTEPAVLWSILVGNPGTAKTHVINHLFKPISDLDNRRYEDYEKDLAIYESDGEKGKKPKFSHSVLREFTFEALAESASLNPHGITILSDEILSLTGNFNRFNKGNDEPYYLTLFSGGGVSSTRKTQAAIHTKHSCVNIIGGIQPNRLRELLTKARFDSGFAQRFLFSYPEAIAMAWSDSQFDETIYQDYCEIVRGIRQLSSECESQEIPLDTDAWQALKHWQTENTLSIRELNEVNDPMAGLRSKWESYVCRFALILEIVHRFCDTGRAPVTIGTQSIRNAIILFDYYLANTEKVFGLIERPEALERLNEKQMTLYRQLPEEFTTKDALDIADKIGVSTRSTYEFLKNARLFSKQDHGKYQKKVI